MRCMACEQDAQIVVFAAQLDELREEDAIDGFLVQSYVADTTCLKWMYQDAPVIPLTRYGGAADLDLLEFSLSDHALLITFAIRQGCCLGPVSYHQFLNHWSHFSGYEPGLKFLHLLQPT